MILQNIKQEKILMCLKVHLCMEQDSEMNLEI